MKILKKLVQVRWALGFVRGGIEAVMNSDQWHVDWVKMPYDCWMADPFVLEVTDDEILLLVEEMPYAEHKGIITLLHIDRKSMEIISRKVLLNLPHHLSFPAIWRTDGHVYVYPESAKSGKLDMYEYDAEQEELTFVKTICDDVIWDSYITEAFGEPLMFTAAHDDHHLDIYKWNEKEERFVAWQNVISDIPNMRMGGGVFSYNNSAYYSAQNCEQTYGGAIDIKRVKSEEVRGKNVFSVEIVKHLESPHPKMKLGMHTINEYKGVVVIDVKGYRYGWIGEMIDKLVSLKKRLRT